jgi:hypothetical protein
MENFFTTNVKPSNLLEKSKNQKIGNLVPGDFGLTSLG